MFFVDRSTNPENLSALAARFVEIWFAQVRGVLLASRAFSAGFARRKDIVGVGEHGDFSGKIFFSGGDTSECFSKAILT